MTFRHLLLTVSGLGVLGLGVYLFLEVRSTTPATADVPNQSARADKPPVAETTPKQPTEAIQAPKGEGFANTNHRVAPAQTEPVAGSSETPKVDMKKDELMSEANKAYDRQDFAEAIRIAKLVLTEEPANVRMLRIVVSSACIDGDSGTAQTSYLMLGTKDRGDMRTRCSRYGVTFTE